MFTVKAAGAGDCVDVAALDAEREGLLKAIFWDIAKLSAEVEKIVHPGSDSNDDVDDSRTEYSHARGRAELFAALPNGLAPQHHAAVETACQLVGVNNLLLGRQESYAWLGQPLGTTLQSQLELAEIAKVSRQAVSRWENGLSAPPTEKLKRLSDVYGVSLDVLLDGNVEADTQQPEYAKLGLASVGEPQNTTDETPDEAYSGCRNRDNGFTGVGTL